MNLKYVAGILKRFKNVKWLDQSPCDVMIYDENGIAVLRRCIPNGAKFRVLPVTEGLPLIKSVRFLGLLITALFIHRHARLALVASIVRMWKPKVVITFIDNSAAIGEIKRIFPRVVAMSVQNGIRHDFAFANQPHFEFEQYFSFGSLERDILLRAGHKVAQVHPVGSLKAGLCLADAPSRAGKQFDLCFISTFEPVHSQPVNPFARMVQDIGVAANDKQHELFRVVLRFAERNNLKLCVAMRGSPDYRDHDEECRYYSIEGAASSPTLIPRTSYSSYDAVRASRLSVTINSTLGFEALGMGQRVLFGQDMTRVVGMLRNSLWGESLTTHRLPDVQRLYSVQYDEFSRKATELMAMSDDHYWESTKEARAYYMNLDPQRLPHEIIKQRIADCFLPRV